VQAAAVFCGASTQLIELHSMPASQPGLQDIELARISQEVAE
jgi:hypothetical protein